VLNPSTEAIITHVERGSNEDIDLAVKSARHAFDHGPWTRMDPSARGDCLFRLADLVKKHSKELA
jgi:acyl-CoA reductase-like NAD-dependent aldehyde dehydrogenase